MIEKAAGQNKIEPRPNPLLEKETGESVVVEKTPLSAGFQAAKANVIPGLIVQGLMLAIVLGYYFYPPMTRCLEVVAGLKSRYGLLYSCISAIIAGCLIPELLTIAVFQRWRANAANLNTMIFAAIYWGYGGCVVDLLYRGQALLFGDAITFPIVFKKVLVDQLIFNPLYAAPFVVIAYDWKNSGYALSAFKGVFTWMYYKNRVIPVLIATWAVWVPIVCVLYSLPQLLQVPLFSLALSLWVILISYMSRLRESHGVSYEKTDDNGGRTG